MKGLVPYTINVGGRLLDLSEPVVMGILNATPDSFYAGSRRRTEAEIEARTCQIVEEGGAIIDVGAYSTRPGAAKVSADEEMERMRMALGAVRRAQPDAVISVDTFRPEVARMSVEEFGAGIINDVSGGNPEGSFGGEMMAEEAYRGPDDGLAYPMFREVARLKVPYILMSSRPNMMSIMQDFAQRCRCCVILATRISFSTRVSVSERPWPRITKCLPGSAFCARWSCLCWSACRASR